MVGHFLSKRFLPRPAFEDATQAADGGQFARPFLHPRNLTTKNATDHIELKQWPVDKGHKKV
jgi:hypothetical protein